MSFRTVLSMAFSIVLGIAGSATVSTEVFARASAKTTHHHHQGVLYRGGHPHHAQTLAEPRFIVGPGPVNSPYCWPYDYSFDPAHYCGASYIAR